MQESHSVKCNTCTPVSLPLFNLVDCPPCLRWCLNRVSFFYCWRKTHFKNLPCGQLMTADKLEQREWDSPRWCQRIDKVEGFVDSSRIDGGDYFLFTDSGQWRDLPPSSVENIKKGIWQRKSDNSIEFLDTMHQYAFDIVKHPSPFHSFPLTPFTTCVCKDPQCPHSVF